MKQYDTDFGPATRAAGLLRLQAFQPRMGTDYSVGRNHDRGPGRHNAVSRLSPYLRRRLLTEREVISAALTAHGPEAGDKFIQEVLWRGYFKGWLERRPQTWTAYSTGLDADLASLQQDPALNARVMAAETGETGITCFDAWVQELTQTGYLHNHARMWFASIWVFTLKLPWRLGADFFFRHLLDGDPASNTCSWRWVAGLHTRGKPYQARASNIAQFSGGRFAPRADELADDVVGLMEEEPDGLPEVQPLRSVVTPQEGVPTALLLTEEDCSIGPEDIAPLDIRVAARCPASGLRSQRPVSAGISAFEEKALADTAARSGVAAEVLQFQEPEKLADWAQSSGVHQIVMPYVPVGPLGDWMERARPILQARGITVAEILREWDALVWPHATAGFFKVKKRLPEILHEAGLT
jgi:hypothetical protein